MLTFIKMEQYVITLVTLTVLFGLIVAAYYVFKNSALGQFMGSVFGDLNGFVGWLGNQIQDCAQDGLTSSKCDLGPWIIGGLVIFGVLALAKAASFLKPFLPEGTRIYEELYGSDADAAYQDGKAAQAEVAEMVQNKTLPSDIQKKYDSLPAESQRIYLDAFTKGISIGKTRERRNAYNKEHAPDPSTQQQVANATDTVIADAATDAKTDAESDPNIDSNDADDVVNAGEQVGGN